MCYWMSCKKRQSLFTKCKQCKSLFFHIRDGKDLKKKYVYTFISFRKFETKSLMEISLFYSLEKKLEGHY